MILWHCWTGPCSFSASGGSEVKTGWILFLKLHTHSEWGVIRIHSLSFVGYCPTKRIAVLWYSGAIHNAKVMLGEVPSDFVNGTIKVRFHGKKNLGLTLEGRLNGHCNHVRLVLLLFRLCLQQEAGLFNFICPSTNWGLFTITFQFPPNRREVITFHSCLGLHHIDILSPTWGGVNGMKALSVACKPSLRTRHWMRCDSPIVEGAGPKQQPTRERNPFVFSGLGEASDEVECENDEERDVPGTKPREMRNEFWVQIK